MNKRIAIVLVICAALVAVAFAYVIFAKDGGQNEEVSQLKKSIEYYSAGQYEKAVNALDAVLKSDPRNDQALLYAGKTYLQLKNFKKAEDNLSLLKGQPKPAMECYTALTEVYVQQKKFDNAMALLKDAVNQPLETAQKAELYFMLGNIYYTLYNEKKDEEPTTKAQYDYFNSYVKNARKAFEKVMELAPADEKARKSDEILKQLKNKIFFEVVATTGDYDLDLVAKYFHNPYLNISKFVSDVNTGNISFDFYFNPTAKSDSYYVFYMKLYDENNRIITQIRSDELKKIVDYNTSTHMYSTSTKKSISIPVDKTVLKDTFYIQIGIAPRDFDLVDPYIDRTKLSTL